MSANQHERLVSNTAEERTARLQQMSANQHERLVSETVDNCANLDLVGINSG